MAHKGRMSSLKLPPNRILEEEIELGRKWFSCPVKVFEILFFPLGIRTNPRPSKDERRRKVAKPRSIKTREAKRHGERASPQHPRLGSWLGRALSWDKEHQVVGSCSDTSLGPEPPSG